MEYFKQAEEINHFVTLNCDTGFLCAYPEVVILEEEDLEDIDEFFKKLEQPPFLLKFRPDELAVR